MSDILHGQTTMCKKCASKKKVAEARERGDFDDTSKFVELSKLAAIKNKEVCAARWEAMGTQFSKKEILKVRSLMSGARGRCTNKRQAQYDNYGGRGVKFVFPSSLEAALWVLNNLGERPSPRHSLDRIDNNGHYEPGNLRWATATEQNRNKRAYKKSEFGHRIKRLHSMRPDVTERTIYEWVNMGKSDEEILNRVKWDGCGKYQQ